LNGARIRASARREDILLSTTAPRKSRSGFENHLAAFSRVVAENATVRCSGSAALDLAYVAAGRLDGMWYPRLNSWDMVAGTLLVKEANGMATAIDGSPVITNGKGSVLATNGLVHKKLQGLLTQA
jgi:myo-inositol-1(or 4)-monophosphatase